MRPPPLEQPAEPSLLRRWSAATLDGCRALDASLRGQLIRVLVAGAAAAGAALPLSMSWAGTGQAHTPLIGALQLGALVVAALTWAARSRPRAGASQHGLVKLRLLALPQRARLDARLLRLAPKSLKLSLLSRWALGAGFAGLTCATVLGLAAQAWGHASGPVLAGLSLWSASLLLLSELLGWALWLQAPEHALPAAELALAAREYPAVVDLAAPLEVESVFLEPTPLHELMAGLSSWRSSQQWHTAEDLAAALQQHLWAAAMPDARLALRRRLGSGAHASVADLVVDDAVLVDFQPGLQRLDLMHVSERLRGYRRAWGERPIVLVVCAAASSEPAERELLEALVAQHELAPLIVAVSRQATP